METELAHQVQESRFRKRKEISLATVRAPLPLPRPAVPGGRRNLPFREIHALHDRVRLLMKIAPESG